VEIMSLGDTRQAFRCCVQIPPDCEKCPQQGPGFGIECRNSVKVSVAHWLALVERKPRLLTIEEMKTRPYGYVLIETDYDSDLLRWVDGLLFCVNQNFSFDFITLEGRARFLGDEYGKTWRCWDTGLRELKAAKPEMEATPWE